MDKHQTGIIMPDLPDLPHGRAPGKRGKGIREAFQVAQELAARCVQALEDQVVGIYLHGSLAMGGFNPASSDIDLLVVVKGDPAREKLLELTSLTLDLHAKLKAGRDIEYTVVNEEVLGSVVCPTPAVYHYSSLHRPRYETDPHYLCADYEDPDLASQIVVAYERGFALYGMPLQAYMPAVPRDVYLCSILQDVAGADTAIESSPMYLTLNLCRVLLFLTEGRIASKKEGGEWGVSAFPEWHSVIQTVLDVYTGAASGPVPVRQDVMIDFARDMLKRIEDIQVNNKA